MRAILKTLPIAVLAITGAVAVHAADLTVDQIIAKNTEARGGAEKLKALNSLKFSGKAVVAGGMEADTVMAIKRPGKVRMDMTIQGQQLTQATDEKSAWMINPFVGGTEAQPMPEDMASGFREGAELEGPFIDYKAKGSTVELAGKEDVKGKPAYILKLKRKDGRVDTYYIDADSFLEVKSLTTRNANGQEMEIETSIGGYKTIDGMKFPASLDQVANGNPIFSLTMDKIEPNVKLDDAMFAMPKAPEKTEKK